MNDEQNSSTLDGAPLSVEQMNKKRVSRHSLTTVKEEDTLQADKTIPDFSLSDKK